MISLLQVRHGGGFARAAHWISAAPAKRWSGVCKSGCESCQNPISESSGKRLQGVRRARPGGNGSYHSELTPISFFTEVGHLRPFLAILVPTCCQEVPNLTPRSPKRAQLVAKIAQNTPQEPPTRPPKTPKCGQNAVVLFVFTLRPFF